uniref:Uncharacterized protein n=1 Tax=Anguilla anguilla TaxID=7936 RepID=A0A0E9XYG5_ANGAN
MEQITKLTNQAKNKTVEIANIKMALSHIEHV